MCLLYSLNNLASRELPENDRGITAPRNDDIFLWIGIELEAEYGAAMPIERISNESSGVKIPYSQCSVPATANKILPAMLNGVDALLVSLPGVIRMWQLEIGVLLCFPVGFQPSPLRIQILPVQFFL